MMALPCNSAAIWISFTAVTDFCFHTERWLIRAYSFTIWVCILRMLPCGLKLWWASQNLFVSIVLLCRIYPPICMADLLEKLQLSSWYNVYRACQSVWTFAEYWFFCTMEINGKNLNLEVSFLTYCFKQIVQRALSKLGSDRRPREGDVWVLGVFAQVGTIKTKQKNVRKVQNSVLSQLKPDYFRNQKVPLLLQLSNSPHKLQLSPPGAIEACLLASGCHCWPFLALFPGEKEVMVAKIKLAWVFKKVCILKHLLRISPCDFQFWANKSKGENRKSSANIDLKCS